MPFIDRTQRLFSNLIKDLTIPINQNIEILLILFKTHVKPILENEPFKGPVKSNLSNLCLLSHKFDEFFQFSTSNLFGNIY